MGIITKSLFTRMGPLGKVTLALFVYSCLMHAWVFFAGVYFNVELQGAQDFVGYLAKLNWSLTPLWWLFLAASLYLAWNPFIAAWRDVHAKGMLLDAEGNPAAEKQVTTFCARLERYRAGLVIPALVISCLITFFDTAELRKIYRACEAGDFAVLLRASGSGGGGKACREAADEALRNLNKACGSAGFNIVHGWPSQAGAAGSSECARVAGSLDGDLEVDFDIAYLLHEHSAGRIDKISLEHNRWLSRALYLQQVALGAMALLGLFQLTLLCNLFWRLENASWLNKEGLRLTLDPYSKLNEFGLESWNHALNNVYWVFSLVLLLPLASRHSQPGEALDFGQMVLQIGVPAIIAMPMLATIIARQQRQKDLWPQILAEENPDKVEMYHRQRLWPLDRNWASKLGIVLSFVMLSYLLGHNLLSLAG